MATTLKSGSKGEDVKKLQTALNNAGYNVGSVDGIYGNKTAAAVKAYQKANGLTVDGIAGTQTFGSLYSSTNNSAGNNASGGSNISLTGVDQNITDKITSNFETSDEVKELYEEKTNNYNNAKDILNQENIVDPSVYDTLGKEFVVPEAVTKADTWLASQLEQIQSGKTSYTDRFNEALNNYLNREDFQYDVDNDQLFQQALASAMNSGKTAMQDTIGQASSLTGGYGSTYATAAGNQAYNAMIEDAYNNLPEYYQMALQAYEAEGQEMYNQVALLGDADANEYQRMINAYDATFQQRNQMYNEAYSTFRDEKTDAYNSANLQLSEYGQKASNAISLYDMSNNLYEQKYGEEYQAWADTISQYTNIAQMQNSDYWSNESLKEQKRQFDASNSGGKNSDGLSSGGLSTTEIKGIQTAYKNAGGGDKGNEAVAAYLRGLGVNVDNETIDTYIASAEAEEGLPVWHQTWTITKDTKNHNWFGLSPDDNNDKYTNLNGETKTYKQLKKEIENSGLPEDEKKALLKSLSDQSQK